jgi:hypothetical protein
MSRAKGLKYWILQTHTVISVLLADGYKECCGENAVWPGLSQGFQIEFVERHIKWFQGPV